MALTKVTTDLQIEPTIVNEIVSTNSIGRKNYIINGGFDVWQRGTTQTIGGSYGSDDRWINSIIGVTTISHSQQSFTLGQTVVEGNPKYFSSTVVTSVVGAGNAAYKLQKIEDVTKLAGKTVTLSFWAKADASKNIAVEFMQFFGAGGSGSASIGITTHSLTTTWQKFTQTVTLPSIAGKTLGTSNNDYLGVFFWFDAGSNYNGETNSLGNQSGTFDIAQVQLEEGSVATSFEPRSYGEELALCHRYYLSTATGANFYGLNFGNGADSIIEDSFPVVMRSIPSISQTVQSGILSSSAQASIHRVVWSQIGSNAFSLSQYTADAEL